MTTPEKTSIISKIITALPCKDVKKILDKQ
jgi:hypothetical protein